MSYQMSRVRGSDEYRLQITRPTTIEAICLWTGIDREDLIAANPHLTVEELSEGQELVVCASWLEETVESNEPSLLSPEWPSSDAVEAPTEQDKDGTSGPEIIFIGHQSDDASGADTPQPTTVTTEGETADTADENPVADDNVNDERVDAGAADCEEEDAEETALQRKEEADRRLPQEPMTWRPFPKSDL